MPPLNNKACRRVLFVLSIHHHTREILPVIEHFRERDLELHVLVGYTGKQASQAVMRLEDLGCFAHEVPIELAYGKVAPSKRSKTARSTWPDIIRILLYPFRAISFVRYMWSTMARSYRHRSFGRSILLRTRPDVIIGGPYQSCGDFQNAISLYAQKTGIPLACLPVSAYLGEWNTIHSRSSNIKSGMVPRNLYRDWKLINRLLAVIFPDWVRCSGKDHFFMWSPLDMLCSWLTGLLEPNPWQKPTDRYDLVFVESSFSMDMLADSGYPREKLIVSGKPLLDSVFDDLSKNEHEGLLREELGLPAADPFILLNVEPGWEHHYLSEEEHWRNLREVFEVIKSISYAVAVSLHPLCDLENYQFIEKVYGFRISRTRKIGEIYPYAQLIVSFPCSTNLFAKTFGKRVIIYDFQKVTHESAPRHELFRVPGSTSCYDLSELHELVMSELERKHTEPEAVNCRKGGASSRIFEIVMEEHPRIACRGGGFIGMR